MKHDISWFFKSKIDDLKKKSTLPEVVDVLHIWLPKEVIKSSYTWEEIQKIQDTFKDIFKVDKQNEIDYFNSIEDQYIYYLVELDGETQQQKLGINRTFFKSLKKAKEWRNNVIKIIHPDKSNHKNATKASEVMNSLYSEMCKNAK